MSEPLWNPSEERIEKAHITRFMRRLAASGIPAGSYEDSYQWSIGNREAFWETLWDFCEVIGERGSRTLVDGDRIPGARWFPDGKLNFEMMVTNEGGLMVRKAEGEQEYFLRPDLGTGHFHTAVEIFRGEEKLTRVSVHDDPERGEMIIEVTPYNEGGLTGVETVKYDPDIPSKFSLSR